MNEATPPQPPSQEPEGLGRRLFIFKALAGAAAVMGMVGVDAATAPAEAQRWTGVTDNDPYDGPGRGRRYVVRRRGRTDADPYDAPGRGIRGRRRGRTDADPYDRAGRGIR